MTSPLNTPAVAWRIVPVEPSEQIVRAWNDAVPDVAEPPHADGWTPPADTTFRARWQAALSAAPSLSQPEVEALRAENERLREIAALADELVNGGGLVNRGVDRGLVVVEKPDRSDPHYRLCVALENPETRAFLSSIRTETGNG